MKAKETDTKILYLADEFMKQLVYFVEENQDPSKSTSRWLSYQQEVSFWDSYTRIEPPELVIAWSGIGTYAITFANIYFNEEFRSRGLFTRIVELVQKKYPNYVICLECIHNDDLVKWCEKNGWSQSKIDDKSWFTKPTVNQ